jgi:two-component system, OmpR family, heavy metal sensor histidine kinase CusS
MSPAPVTPPAHADYAIERRLAWRIAAQVALALALMVGVIGAAAYALMDRKQAAEQAQKIGVIRNIVNEAARAGGVPQVARTLAAVAQRRPLTRLELTSPDGAVFYRDPEAEPFLLSRHQRSDAFTIDLTPHGGGLLSAVMTVDTEQDTRLLRGLAWTLLLVPLVGGALVGLSTAWRVRRELVPLAVLAAQTERIKPERLDQRLALPEVAVELAPWITQFNALMDRLQSAVEQLEAFNADVAHELRTPLAAMMGHTEVALAKERPANELREVMTNSLEELQRLSAMVSDMLFLSRADRGAVARRGEPQSLKRLAERVVEFHDFMLDDAGLSARVEGDAQVAVDAALVQRALSNLIGNATRYGEPGSTVVVRIGEASAPQAGVELLVENRGPAIDPSALPRLFDRFFRADAARTESGHHHGLGLAIVAAIARMHGGRTAATSKGGTTRIGFTLAVG